MRKAYSFKKLGRKVQHLAAIMLVTLMAVGSVFAEEVTFTFAEQGYSNAQVITEGEINSLISFTCAANSASAAPTYYTSGSAARFYANAASGNGSSMTLIPQDGYQITGLTITATGASNAPLLGIEVDGGARTTYTAEGAVYTITGLTATSSLMLINAATTNTQLRVVELTITYGVAPPPAVYAPVFSPVSGNYYTAQTVSLTCASEGANIYYSINGAEPVLYSAPFTVDATANITAYATLGEDVSATTSAQYVFPVFLSNIAAFYAAEDANLYKITSDMTFVYRNGRYMYVKDATGGLLIYDNYNPIITTEYNEGDVFTGGVVGSRSIYNGLAELVPSMNTAEASALANVNPVEVTAAELLANPEAYVSQLVVVKNGTFAAGSFNNGYTSNINFTQDGSTVVVRSAFKNISATFTAGTEATVVGLVTIYNNAVQLYPRDNNDIAMPSFPYTYNFEAADACTWLFANGDNANKWYTGRAQGFDNKKLYVSSSNGYTNKYNVSSASVTHAYVPVTLPANDMLLTFDLRSVGEANDFVQVAVMDEIPVAGTLPEEYLARYYGVSDFTNETLVIPAANAGEKYLVFTWSNDGSGGVQTPAAIDNVVLKNSCEMVSEINAAVNEHTAVLTWTAPAGQDAWTVEYKEVNSDEWTSTEVTSATLTLTDLITNTAYDVRIRSNCGEAASNWATYQFAVPCIDVTMGDVEITIGEGSLTTYYAPFGPFYRNSWVQMIYPASYFETSGYINSISWEVNSANVQECSSLKIYIGTTTHENNTSTTDWLPMEDLTLVYDASDISIGSAAGWETYTLNNPYFYNGEDNLVIVTSRSAAAYKSLYYKATGNNTNAVMYRWNDNDASYASHPGDAAATGRNANLPNMFLDYTGFVCGDAPCKTPKNLVVDNHVANTIVTWLGVPGVTEYEVQYAESGSDAWASAIVNDATTLIVSNLTEGVSYDVRVRSVCDENVYSDWTSIVTFTRPAYCNIPTSITTTSITSSQATLTWEAGEGTSWVVEYGEDGFTLGEGTQVTTTANTVTITGLDADTDYDVYVKANCGDYPSAWSSAYSFTTNCLPYTITAGNPWFENFEGYPGSGEQPFQCWLTPVKPNGPFVYCGYSSSCHSGANSAEFKGNTNMLLLPEFTNDIHTLSLSFWATATSTSLGQVEVGVVTDINDMSTFEYVATTGAPSERNGVGNYMGPFSFENVVANGGRIALRYTNTNSSSSWNLDDFTVFIPQNCASPVNLAANVNNADAAAVITWNPFGADTAWQVQYGENGFTLGEGTVANATEASYTMTGLTGGTTYDVYVRTMCSETEGGEWAGPVTFEVAAISACTEYCTYTLDLNDSWGDSWNGGSLMVSQNGVEIGTYTVADTFATFTVDLCSGVEAVFTYTTGSYASENNMTVLDPAGNVVWTYNGGSGSTTYTITPSCGGGDEPEECENACEYTFVLTDTQGDGWIGNYFGNNAGSLDIVQNDNLVQTLTLSAGLSQTYNVSLCSATATTLTLHPDYWGAEVGLTVMDPQGVVIWQINAGTFADFGGNEDSVFVFTPVCITCDVPTNLIVDAVTATSATLSWTGEDTLAYNVYYRNLADNDWTVMNVTGDTVVLALAANTTYVAKVKADCSMNEFSEEVMFFTTASAISCNVFTVSAQDDSGYYTPVNDYYRNSHTEQIYTPEEVGATGNITKLSFNYAGSSTMVKKTNVKIYLGHTTKSEFASTTDWTTSGLTLVYTGDLNCAPGWNEFELDEEFAYNGSDNLLVCFDDESGDYGSSSNKFYYTNCSGYKCLTWQSDSYTWTNASSKSGSRRTYRPDIRFNLCSAGTDMALTAIHNIPNGCDLTNLPVTIDMRVAGATSVSTIKAYYRVNGGNAVQETITLAEPMNQGDEMTYTFNTLATLPLDANYVTAWIEIDDDGNVANNILTAGPVVVLNPMDLPFVETFNAGEINDGWFVRDVNGDNVTFTIANGVASYPYSDEVAADDWLMTSCMGISVGFWTPGIYDVSYSYKANDAALTESFGVYYGTKVGDDYVMDNEVATHVFNNTDYVTAHNLITVTQSGVYYFGIHAASLPGNAGFQINNFSVKPTVQFTVNAAEHGSTEPEGTVYLAQGDEYTITIIPDFGYHVAAIYKNYTQVRGENTDNAAVEYYTFTPNNNDNIYVTFTTNKYEVNATATNLYVTGYNDNAPGATYTPNHEIVAHGGSHTGVITLAENYHLYSVTVNGMDVTSTLVALNNNQYQLTLNNIYENKNINVVAELDSTTITYTVLAGEGTINGEYVVDANTTLPAVYTVTLPGYSDLLSTITPAPGYHVSSIIIDGVEHNLIDIYSFEHLFGDHTVVVTFAPNHYVITTAGYGNGTVSAGVEFDYNPDFTYTFTATPDAGYCIGTITRNNAALTVADPAAGYTETLTNIVNNYNYEVTFVQNTYTITASCGNNGIISPEGTAAYLYHQNAVYSITAAQGYYISSVTVDGTATYYTQADALTSTTYTFGNIEASHTISATFAPMSFEITVNAGSNGAITPATATYAYGTTPTFTITPDAGYSIADVTVDGVSVGAVATYTFLPLTTAHTIAATFVANVYTIMATAGNGGTISPAGASVVIYNADKTFTISANTGYHVSDVFVDGASVGAVTSYTFTGVAANHTIYAAFEANEYTITVNQPAHGTITPGTTTVLYGATPSFVITPATGYNVTAITVNGSNVNLSNVPNVNGTYTYTFAAISSSQTITATMTAKTFTINASAGTNGSITPNGNTTVNYGGSQVYTITPANGYVVAQVTVDGMSIGAPTSYVFTNVIANHTINATFQLAECEAPTYLYTTHIDSTSAELHWSHPSATTFNIQYKTPTGTFTSVSSVSGNSYQLTNLNPATTYLWQVQAVCAANNHSEWANLVSFQTDNTTIDETGIEDLVKNNIKVYAEHQNVHILNNEGMNIDNVRIFDAYGKLIYSGAVNTTHEVINLSVAAGAYIVNVTTDKGVANYKVTILK